MRKMLRGAWWWASGPWRWWIDGERHRDFEAGRMTAPKLVVMEGGPLDGRVLSLPPGVTLRIPQMGEVEFGILIYAPALRMKPTMVNLPVYVCKPEKAPPLADEDRKATKAPTGRMRNGGGIG